MKTYKDAGVDKEAGYQTIKNIKKAVESTHTPHVMNSLGSFGAMYELGKYANPVLVSGTDGVGTKLRIALDVKKYDTVGIDCFAMCANDILCHGAKPLFFLDYLACGNLDATIAAEIVQGMVQACKETHCALIGGETAEMPGMYQQGDYDIAGFCVGIVEKSKIIDGSLIEEGQTILALPSSGFHSNGFSLIRKVFTNYYEEFEGQPIYETLLTPTKLYQNTIETLINEFSIYGIAHITGGGLYENIPRIIPNTKCAAINFSTIEIPSIMVELQKRANIELEEMFHTFNMGIGMVVVVNTSDVPKIIEKVAQLGEKIYPIGTIISNKEEKILIDFNA